MVKSDRLLEDRSFELHYAARCDARFLPLDGYSALTHFYAADKGARLDVEAVLSRMPKETDVYVCGPKRLIDNVRDVAASLGISNQHVHFESFGPSLMPTDQAITVHLSISEISVEVPPGKSILDALLEAGIWAPYECRRGECASCITPVLDGEPEHRDHCLSPELRCDNICTCISWARTREITLDL